MFIASAEIPEREGSILPSSFNESHAFCLVYQMDEFSF